MFNDQNVAVKSDSLFPCPLSRLPNKIDIKDPPLERHSRVFRYNCYNELRHRPRKQPCYRTSVTVWAEMMGLLLICFNILDTVCEFLAREWDNSEYFSR